MAFGDFHYQDRKTGVNVRELDSVSQSEALRRMVGLVEKSIGRPIIRETAFQVIRSCESRDDACELQAIFNAVKHGDAGVPRLARSFKYIADPNRTDYFVAPYVALAHCESGACGGDCDDHSMLICALAAQIGYTVGFRAYGKNPRKQVYNHVYAVVGFPKRKPQALLPMDTTHPPAYPGWQPPVGCYKTVMVPN